MASRRPPWPRSLRSWASGSPTFGTAGDAINHLTVAKDVQTHLANQIPAAFAVTYLVGVIVAAWFLAQVGPRILGVDLAAECRASEEKMGGGERRDQVLMWRMFEVRTFRVANDSRAAGRSLHDVERMVSGARLVRVVDIDLGDGTTKRSVTRGTQRAAAVLRALAITDLEPPTPPQPGATIM
jgi:uncharacterized transporter YbjL